MIDSRPNSLSNVCCTHSPQSCCPVLTVTESSLSLPPFSRAQRNLLSRRSWSISASVSDAFSVTYVPGSSSPFLSTVVLLVATASTGCLCCTSSATLSLWSSSFAASITSLLSTHGVPGCHILLVPSFGPYFSSSAFQMSAAYSSGSAIFQASEPGTSVDMIMALARAFLVVHSL